MRVQEQHTGESSQQSRLALQRLASLLLQTLLNLPDQVSVSICPLTLRPTPDTLDYVVDHTPSTLCPERYGHTRPALADNHLTGLTLDWRCSRCLFASASALLPCRDTSVFQALLLSGGALVLSARGGIAVG